MNVLSLFDGMSCGQIALNKLGIKVDNYFASEIDENAIKVTKHNYPDTKHIGSVTEILSGDLPNIDLLIGGSSCQNFSFAGSRIGMKSADDFEILTLKQYLGLKNEGLNSKGKVFFSGSMLGS